MKRIGVGIIVVAGAGLLATSVAYFERGPIGIRLATDYLQKRGVPAAIHLDRLDWRGASGSAVLGRPGQPDLSIEHFDVAFSAFPLFRGVIAAPRVTAIRLVRPHLMASWRSGRMSFGALQPLVDDARAQPGGGGPGPDVVIEDGDLRLTTPYGIVHLAGDGHLAKGRLSSATLRLTPGNFAGPNFGAVALAGEATLNATGPDRLRARLHVSAAAVQNRTASARGVDLTTDADLPYGSGKPAFQGRLGETSHLKVASLAAEGAKANSFVVDLNTSGVGDRTSAGGQFQGQAVIVMTAASARQGKASVVSPALCLSSPSLSLAVSGKAIKAAGPYKAGLTADHGQVALRQRTLVLAGLHAGGGGRIDVGPGWPRLAFRGGARLNGALGAADAQALAGVAAGHSAQSSMQTLLAQNLRSFRLQIPGVEIETAANRLLLKLSRPAELDLAAGAVLQVAAKSGEPLLLADSRGRSGGLQAQLKGPGLPDVSLTNAHFRTSPGPGDLALQGAATLQAKGSSGAIHGASLLAPLSVALAKGRLTIVAIHCATFGLDSYQPGPDATLKSVKGQFCPVVEPLLELSPSSWALAASLQDLTGELPAADIDLQAGQARVQLSGGGPHQPTGSLQIDAALTTDTHAGAEARFRPIQTTGRFELAKQIVSGKAQLALADNPQAQAQLTLRHDLAFARGDAEVSVTDLHFEPKGLQPESLSPALATLASQVKGGLAFTGHLAWRNGKISSDGRLSTTGLDLRSPAGQVTGLRADLHFSSLTPLLLQPAQTVTADGLQTLLPLTALSATFGLSPTALTLVAASATVAKGQASLGPAVLILTPGAPPTVSDTLTLRSVDVQDLVSSLNLAKAVTIQAKISGAVPFTLSQTGLRFADGRLAADGPGRLSIRREALTNAVATGGAAGAQPNAVQDFAYQALEDLAFDQLDASVASRPQGRLGVVLHVKGRHDPPTAPPSRIGLLDLLRGHAFDKPIPLPKATPVDLTLDTSLNFDELVEAYAGLNGASRAKVGGSVAVQP